MVAHPSRPIPLVPAPTPLGSSPKCLPCVLPSVPAWSCPFFRILKDRYTGQATGKVIPLTYDAETGLLSERALMPESQEF